MTAATTEPNEWVRPVSLGVTATLIVWCFCGWIIDKGWTLEGALLATMTGVFQALGFNASAQMRRAAAKHAHRVKKFWAYVLVVTAGWTAFAAHHAYTVIAGEPPAFAWTLEAIGAFVQSSAALVLLAAAATIDPLLGWAIEETEKAEAPKIAQPPPPATDTKIDAKIDRSLDRRRAKPKATNGIRRAVGDLAKAGAVGAVMLTGAQAAATEAPKPPQTATQSKPVAAPTTATEQRAVAMLTGGVSLRAVERETGLTYARVRALREWVSRAA